MDTTSYTTILLERRGRVLHAKFNRPASMNAINHDAHVELARFFGELAVDPLTDIAVLSGAGRAFSAGGDIEHMQTMIDDPRQFSDQIPDMKRLIFSLLDCPKPIIAKVNGAAVGLGATIALFCDVIFAAENVKIGDPHVRVGLVAGDGGAVIWPHLIGHARAKELLLTGRLITSEQAFQLGLINRVVPAGDLDRVVDEFVGELAKGAMQAIQWTKLSVNVGLKQLAQAVLESSAAYEALSNRTEDHREAVRALREKRTPQFTGR